MSDDELTFASAGVAGVHYARCWPCMFDQHPGGWHTWADAEDVIHALKTGQPDPSEKRCGCACTDDPPSTDLAPEDLEAMGDDQPCAECGEHGACAYDSEGRPMVHATWMDDGEADA